MSNDIHNISPERLNALRVGPPKLPVKPQPAVQEGAGKASFADHLKSACREVGCRTQFSGHAESRVETRQITLDSAQLARIDRAVDAVADKGARQALVMLDNMALIVGVEKRTVITLADTPQLRNQVFTAIDAAVVA